MKYPPHDVEATQKGVNRRGELGDNDLQVSSVHPYWVTSVAT